MVPDVGAAVHKVDLNDADHGLDFEHYSHLLCLASAHSRTALVGAWLDIVVGIWIRDSSCCHYRFAWDQTIGRTTMLSGPGRVKATSPHEIHVSRDLCRSSKTTFVSFTEEDIHDKVAPFHDDLLPIFWGAGPCSTLLGTDTPTRSRTTCQNLWPGFLRANCGGALYVQPRSTGFESESLPYLDLGAQDRPGHVRNKRQGWQAGQGYVQPVTAQQRAGQRERRN